VKNKKIIRRLNEWIGENKEVLDGIKEKFDYKDVNISSKIAENSKDCYDAFYFGYCFGRLNLLYMIRGYIKQKNKHKDLM
jgi:hypothetical protein